MLVGVFPLDAVKPGRYVVLYRELRKPSGGRMLRSLWGRVMPAEDGTWR